MPLLCYDGIAMVGKAHQFMQPALPAILKPISSLWTEPIALVFVVLALPAITKLIGALRGTRNDATTTFEIILTSIWAVIMVYFAFASFRRARKISRS